ncbi:MAG: hypothetical protein WDA22_04600 [Bacteroidota bacterium]
MIKLTSRVSEQLGKVFLNIGQGLILAGIVGRLIQHDTSIVDSIVAYLLGAYAIGIGLYFISRTNVEEE